MMLFPEHTKKEETTFRHFAILGSNLGPRNTIIVPGYLSAVLSREIKGSAAGYLTYRVDGQDESNQKVVLDVRLYESRKGMGAPGVKAQRPWLSIILTQEAIRLGNPLAPLNTSLESLGFTKVSSTATKTENGVVRELVTTTYKGIEDALGQRQDASQFNWHSLSAFGEGIRFHIGTTNLTAQPHGTRTQVPG